MKNKHKSQSLDFYSKTRNSTTCHLKLYNYTKINSRYLGLILDQGLTWVHHVKNKCILLNSKQKSLCYPLGEQSSRSLKQNCVPL